MPVNLVFQVLLDHYPWYTLVWDVCHCASTSLLKFPHISLNIANVFDPCSYLKMNWSQNLPYFFELIFCMDGYDGYTSDTKFIDVLFYGRSGP